MKNVRKNPDQDQPTNKSVKQIYIIPEIRVVEVAVETGFANSPPKYDDFEDF